VAAIKPDGWYAQFAGSWQAWAAQGANADEIVARIEQVPEVMRERVRAHCRVAWRVRQGKRGGE